MADPDVGLSIPVVEVGLVCGFMDDRFGCFAYGETTTLGAIVLDGVAVVLAFTPPHLDL